MTAGVYYIDYVVSANDSANIGSFYVQFSMNGDFWGNAYMSIASVSVPLTGSWTTFQTITDGPFSLNGGQQVMRIAMNRSAFNLDKVIFRVTTDSPTPSPTPGPANALFIEAEDYTIYSDTTVGNAGGMYRNDNVDIEVCHDGTEYNGYDICWMASGEWLQYDINVVATDTFTLYTRVSSVDVTGLYHIELDGLNITGTMSFTPSGGWQTWKDSIKTGISLTAGPHSLEICLGGRGF